MDRENVIKGLMEIVNFFDIMSTIESRCNELKQDAENAIDFLKEQETEKKCCKDCEYYGNCHDT